MDYFSIGVIGLDLCLGYQCLKLSKIHRDSKKDINRLEKDLAKEDHLLALLKTDFPAYCKEVGIA